MPVVATVHTGEEGGGGFIKFVRRAVVYNLITLVAFYINRATLIPVNSLPIQRRIVILTRKEGPITILLAIEIAHQGKDILGRVLVHGWIGHRANNDHGEGRIAHHYYRDAGKNGIHYRLVVDIGVVDAVNESTHQQKSIHPHSTVEGQAPAVDKQQLEPGSHLDDSRNDAVKNDPQNEKGQRQGFDGITGRYFILFIIIDHRNGRNGQEVQQVHPNGESHQVGDENEPAVGVGFIRHILPLEYGPKNHSCKEGRHGINLTFHGRKPKGVRESISQRTNHSGSHNCPNAPAFFLALLHKNFTGKVGNGPEQKRDGKGRSQTRHEVYCESHIGGITCKERKKPPHQHEEGRSGRVPYEQLVRRRDKFSTIPKAGGWLQGKGIYHGSNQKGQPAQQGVQAIVVQHIG